MERNRFYKGDCLELMQEIPAGSVDMILCDLPYGQTHNKWDSVIPFEPLWEQYCRVIKDNGAIVLFAQGMFTAQLMASNSDRWRYNLIWEKTTPTGFLNANKMPLRAHEDICVFYKRLPTYNPQKTQGHERKVSKAAHKKGCKQSTNYGYVAAHSYESTERHPRSVLKFSTDKQTCSIHPTQKPVAICEYLIKTYTNPGELVLDNTAGSATTGIACLNTDRDYILIEKDEQIYAAGFERLREHVYEPTFHFHCTKCNEIIGLPED